MRVHYEVRILKLDIMKLSMLSKMRTRALGPNKKLSKSLILSIDRK